MAIHWLPDNIAYLTPYLTVRDAEAMIDFYERAFGFVRSELMPGEDGKPVHVSMTYLGTETVMFAPENTQQPCRAPATSGVQVPINLYLYCEDVDSFIARAEKAGATIISKPEDMFWGDRIAQVEDPDGYRWTFATKVAEFDPAKIPSAG